MKKLLLTLLLLGAIVLPGCNNASNNDPNANIDSLKPAEVIFKIDGKPITKESFNVSFDKLYLTSPFGRAKVDLSKDKNHHLLLLFRAKAVNDLIIRHFIGEEAKKHGISASDEEVKEVMDKITQKVGGVEKLQDQISVSGLTMEQFKDSIKSDIIAKKVVDKMSENMTITDEEVKEYYEKNKDTKFNIPETARASHIFIKADDRIIENKFRTQNKTATEEQIKAHKTKEIAKKKQEALAILNTVKANPASFEDVAKEKSDDKITALKGGDMGYFPKGLMVDAIDEVVFNPQKAKVGSVYGELVQSKIGFHIVKVTDHRKKGIIALDTIKNDIKRMLKDSKKVDILNDFVNKKKSRANIEYLYNDFDQKVINEKLSENPKRPANQATSDIKTTKESK